AARGRGDADVDDEPPPPGRETWVPCAIVGGVVFLARYTVEFDLLTIESALLWLVSLLAFVAVMGLTAQAVWRSRWVAGGLVAGAAVLLTHNQIEMTFHHAPSALPAWIALGLAASRGAAEARPRRWDAAAALLPLVAAVALVALAAY